MSNEYIKQLDDRGLRNFAYTMAAIIVALFGLLIPWFIGFSWPYWPWLLGCLLTVWGLLAPGSLNLVYMPWMRFGLLLNKITTPIILGTVFFVVILPIGLIRRLIKDPLNRRFDADTKSYREESDHPSKQNLEHPY